MDAQIDYAAGMPVGLLDELPPAIDATELLFDSLQEPPADVGTFRKAAGIAP